MEENFIINFQKLRHSPKKMEILAGNAFYSFRPIRWTICKQRPFSSSKSSKNILFLVLLSEMIIPEVIRASS